MRIAIWIAALLTPLLMSVLSSDASVALRLIAILATLFPLGLWVALRRPLYIYAAFGFALGAVPFGVLPGSPLPLTLLLAVSIGVTTLIHLPRGSRAFTSLEWWMLGLIVTSTLSMIVTLSTSYDLTEFTKWLVASSVVFSLLRLERVRLEIVGRWYVFGAACASAFALVILFFDSSGRLLSLLSFLGYGTGDDNLRFVFNDEGPTVRLTGTYVDPNAGGLFLFVGVLLALALFRGVWRIGFAGLIALAMTLTLSRAALLTLVAAFLIFMAVQRMRFSGKARIFSVAALAGAALLAIPAIQNRIFESFGSNDTGSTARGDALRDFPKHMDGNWLFGLGWGRIEFRDGRVGIAVNHVANAPLLSVYRGGLVVGLFFCAVLIVGIVMSIRGLRQPTPEFGFVGAGFIGFVLIALQLDFPVITIPPVAALFAFFLAFLPKAADFPDPPGEPQSVTQSEIEPIKETSR